MYYGHLRVIVDTLPTEMCTWPFRLRGGDFHQLPPVSRKEGWAFQAKARLASTGRVWVQRPAVSYLKCVTVCLFVCTWYLFMVPGAAMLAIDDYLFLR